MPKGTLSPLESLATKPLVSLDSSLCPATYTMILSSRSPKRLRISFVIVSVHADTADHSCPSSMDQYCTDSFAEENLRA
ncbi:MAG: hypothetical protein IJW67_09830 [Blautia sp.]|nr:hypothetical protein [Blautia sp.]